MCGLLGAAGDITYKEIDAFKELLYISSLRGWDSTGVAVFTRKSDGDPFSATVLKTTGPSYNMLDSRAFDKAIGQTHKKILMGHTRAATVGNIRASNAHPFEFEKYVGAHNGTLDYSTRRELPFATYFDTDSEALISAINDHGIKETIESQEGAWALSLVNKHEGTLQFLRNKERDLVFCFKEDQSAIYWASEPAFLRFVLARRDIKIAEDKVFRFAENLLYTYDIPLKCGKFESPEREAIKGKERAPFMGRHGNGNNASHSREAAERVFKVPYVDQKKRQEKETSNITKLFTKHNMADPNESDQTCSISLLPKFHQDFYEKRGKKRHFHHVFKALGGKYWDQRMFTNLTKQGCGFCTEVPTFGDNIVVCRENIFLCQKCSGDDGIEEAIRTDQPMLPVMSANENIELNDPLPTIN